MDNLPDKPYSDPKQELQSPHWNLISKASSVMRRVVDSMQLGGRKAAQLTSALLSAGTIFVLYKTTGLPPEIAQQLSPESLSILLGIGSSMLATNLEKVMNGDQVSNEELEELITQSANNIIEADMLSSEDFYRTVNEVTAWLYQSLMILHEEHGQILAGQQEGFNQVLEAIADLKSGLDTEPTSGNYESTLLNLPSKDFGEFVGRQDQIGQLAEVYRDSNGNQMASVIGLGGLGKTALAWKSIEHEVTSGEGFDYVVWTSAKQEAFDTGTVEIRELGNVNYNLNHVSDEIARQTARMDVIVMPVEQKIAAIKHLLSTNKILVVMDNLETLADVPENRERENLIRDVHALLGNTSKILITSRHRITNPAVKNIPLGGLSIAEGIQFLRVFSEEHGVHTVMNADDEVLLEIHRATGGAPLAMRLVVGQMGRGDMHSVLNNLKEVTNDHQNYNFYRFMYRESWKLLSREAQILLVDASSLRSITGSGLTLKIVRQREAKRSEFQQEGIFEAALAQLIDMSLINLGGTAGKERLTMHKLTYNFIHSDITQRQEWGNE